MRDQLPRARVRSKCEFKFNVDRSIVNYMQKLAFFTIQVNSEHNFLFFEFKIKNWELRNIILPCYIHTLNESIFIFEFDRCS